MKSLLQHAKWATCALIVAAGPAQAIEQVTLAVGRAQAPGALIGGAQVKVRLGVSGLSLEARAASIRVRRPGTPPLRTVHLACGHVHIGQTIRCQGGQFAALAGPLGELRGTASASYGTRTGRIAVRAHDVAVAGGQVSLSGTLHPGVWHVTASATNIDLARTADLARPWFRVPTGDTVGGRLSLQLQATNRPVLQVQFAARSPGLNFSNAAGTMVSQHVAIAVSGTVKSGSGGPAGTLRLQGSRGQALVGPIYLDLAAHPVTLRLKAARHGSQVLEVSSLQLHEPGVIDAQASALLALATPFQVRTAHLTLARLTFPGAYTSFLQMSLASTALGALNSGGWASGSLTLRAGRIERIDAALHGLNFSDPAARLAISDANGALHWALASGVAVAHSHLSWREVSLYGLAGGPAQLTFLAWNHNFALLGGNVRLPIFDGAIVVHTLVGRNIGTPHAQLDFDADLMPISMPLLSKAFGWPIMNGHLYGHIPLVQYRHHVLTFNGALVAHVFDGVITGNHIRLDDPLGQWPQLGADVMARGLDLGMVTRTFAFGSMTGRIDADIKGLKLFDWSPVAFDARLYTMPGDRSKHLISQKAVTRIAAFGGGGGEVAAALESGVLRFFKTFHYRRLAIGCRLRNEVCHMSGVRPSDDGGYYLVEGSWLPRLDIIGNVQRVNWPQMLAQISQGIRSGGVKVN